MQKRGLLNRLRSYIWKEGQEPEKKVQISLDDTQSTINPTTSGKNTTTSGSFSAGSGDSPNEELRSFFEQTGDRELSKVEVLGVLNLISQAVVRDESVLDLSTISQSANSSSAFPPNLSNSFSTSNIGDLTSGSRSRRSTRRPLASGPKRYSTKSIVRSQSNHGGISMRKTAAPVDTTSRSKRAGIKSSVSMRDIPRNRMTVTASDVLSLIDNPDNSSAPVTPGKGLRRRPGTITSTPVSNVPTTVAAAEREQPKASPVVKPASNGGQNLSLLFSKDEETPVPAVSSSQAPLKESAPAPAPVPVVPAPVASTPKPGFESAQPNLGLFSQSSAPTLPPIDVNVDMEFDFPTELAQEPNQDELNDGQKYANEFIF